MRFKSRIFNAVLGLLVGLTLAGTACQATPPVAATLPASPPAAGATSTATPGGSQAAAGEIPTITPAGGQAAVPSSPTTPSTPLPILVPTDSPTIVPTDLAAAAPSATLTSGDDRGEGVGPAATASPAVSPDNNAAASAGSSSAAACAPSPLGPASDFNLFVLGNLNQSNSATQGRIAAAGDIFLGEYKVGDGLDPTTWSGRDVIIAGRDFHFSHGQIFYGNAVYGNTSDVSPTVTIEGELRQDSPINFSEATQTLQTLSTYWAGLPANGTTDVQYHGQPTGEITLTGTDPDLNVFTVSGEDLAAANSLNVEAPSSSTVIVNVTGVAGRMNNFDFSFDGVDPTRVYYNFSQANRLSLEAISVEGNILAPFAAVQFRQGAISGTLVGASLDGSGQANLVPPAGCLPWPTGLG